MALRKLTLRKKDGKGTDLFDVLVNKSVPFFSGPLQSWRRRLSTKTLRL